MSDILADYREWKAEQEERIGTHSDRCHLWHERCMIHRLAAELEQTREAIRRLADQDATLSVCDGNVTVTMDATLTDEERAAVAWFANYGYSPDGVPGRMAATLRGLLERHFPTPEKRPVQDNSQPASETVPSGKDSPLDAR